MKRIILLLSLLIALLLISCDSDLSSWVILDEPKIQAEELDYGYNIIIRNSNPKAKIYYTLDGSEPDESSKRYEEAFEIKFGTTVKAFSKLGAKSSGVSLLVTEQPTTTAPVIVIDRKACTASIECSDPKAQIYYKIDEDSFSLYTYQTDIAVKTGSIISAKSVRNYYKDSEIVQEMNVPFDAKRTSTPAINTFVGGEGNTAVSYVTIKTDEDVQAYYTLDGSEPSKDSIKYDGGFWVFGEQTVKAIAIPPTILGMNNSLVYSAVINEGKSPISTSDISVKPNLPSWMSETMQWKGVSNPFLYYSSYAFTVFKGSTTFFITQDHTLITIDELLRKAGIDKKTRYVEGVTTEETNNGKKIGSSRFPRG